MDVGVRRDMNRRLETIPTPVKQNLHVCNFWGFKILNTTKLINLNIVSVGRIWFLVSNLTLWVKHTRFRGRF